MAEAVIYQCSQCSFYSPNYVNVLNHRCAITDGENSTNIGQNTSTKPHSSANVVNEDILKDINENSIFHWRSNDVKLLISIMKERLEKLQSPYISNKKVWQQISESMKEMKYNVTAIQCENKWRSLKKTYKKIKDHNSKSGNDRKTWDFYEMMDKLLGNKPEIEPISTESNYVSTEDISFSQASSSSSTHCSDDISENNETNLTSISTKLGKTKRKRKMDEEPLWFAEFRKTAEKQHKERMELQNKLINILSTLAEKIN